MTKSKRFVMKDPNDWGYPITDTDTGKVYSCASNIWMKELCTDINKIVDENEQFKNLARDYNIPFDKLCETFESCLDENEQLKKELSEYKDFVFSDDKILCYTCLFCTHKGIYEVDCDMKGHVDVHSFCFSYTKKELQE